MLPLADHNPRRTVPVVNYLLVAANVWVFLWELSLGPNIERDLFIVSFVPARFWAAPLDAANIIRIFISMFLHGGWLHLGGNMLFLWIFGHNVEDEMGRGRFVLFYLASGIAAAMSQVIAASLGGDSSALLIPMVGASGAIAGVLAAYMVLFPRSRVLTLIPIFIFIRLVHLPAAFFIGLWFAIQLLSAFLGGGGGGVAFAAHVGGFVAGYLLVRLGRITPAWRARRPGW